MTIVTDMRARPGDVIGSMKVKPEHPEDDVIDHDIILVWQRKGASSLALTSWDACSVGSLWHHGCCRLRWMGDAAAWPDSLQGWRPVRQGVIAPPGMWRVFTGR
jgi:hypothetical protein